MNKKAERISARFGRVREVISSTVTSQVKARMAVFSYIEGWYNPGMSRPMLKM